jgi:redox-sensitive bicupin YhaK (pirin superfamily)
MSIPADSVEQLLAPATRDLGDGFTVRRALPMPERRSVGPFVFFDQMGPTGFGPGAGLDVRPHPHIGLATVTYLFDGELLHRDSLGSVQVIRPGEVNWMVAGRGIVHSERTPPANRSAASRLSGIQMWVGLPRREEQMPPLFSHHGAEQLPLITHAGVRLRLIAGALAGERSPVQTLSAMFYAHAELQADGVLLLEPEYAERAIYLYAGSLRVDGQPFEAGRLLVLRAGRSVQIRATEPAQALLLGGAPLDGPRFLWWNFVASTREQLRVAGEQWRSGGFGTVPGDAEFIPLPDTMPPQGADAATGPVRPVDYP